MLCCSHCSGPELSADDSEEAEKVEKTYFYFLVHVILRNICTDYGKFIGIWKAFLVNKH